MLEVLAVGKTWLCVGRGAATGVVSCDSCPPLAAATVRPQHGTGGDGAGFNNYEYKARTSISGSLYSSSYRLIAPQ